MTKKNLILTIVVILLIGGLGGGSFYFYSQYRKSQSEIEMLKNNPQEAAKIETQKVVDTINKLIILPVNETPINITVTDKEKLKGQSLFADAENGDIMLVYSQAKKAILYRPSLNKIVAAFENITLNNPTPTPAVLLPGQITPTSTPNTP